jgi:hypothetical protein
MPAPTACTVCEHPDRERIDVALRGSASLRSIAKSFGLGRTAITGHASKHTTAEQTRKYRVAARGGRRRSALSVAVAPVSLDSPADVLAELRFLYGETKSLYETAKASHDLRLMDKAISNGAALLDRFAKSFGMFQDGGTTINVNPIDAKIIAVVQSMTTEELREYIRSTKAAPDTLAAVSE